MTTPPDPDPGPDPDPDPTPDPEDQARRKQHLDELALKEAALAELTGERPPIEIRFFEGELITLLRLLGMLEGLDRFAIQAGQLIDTINRQIDDRADPPAGGTPSSS
jgi:hypothetical protein